MFTLHELNIRKNLLRTDIACRAINGLLMIKLVKAIMVSATMLNIYLEISLGAT